MMYSNKFKLIVLLVACWLLVLERTSEARRRGGSSSSGGNARLTKRARHLIPGDDDHFPFNQVVTIFHKGIVMCTGMIVGKHIIMTHSNCAGLHWNDTDVEINLLKHDKSDITVIACHKVCHYNKSPQLAFLVCYVGDHFRDVCFGDYFPQPGDGRGYMRVGGGMGEDPDIGNHLRLDDSVYGIECGMSSYNTSDFCYTSSRLVRSCANDLGGPIIERETNCLVGIQATYEAHCSYTDTWVTDWREGGITVKDKQPLMETDLTCTEWEPQRKRKRIG